MAVGVGYAELLPDSSSQAPLNEGKWWDLDGGRPVVAPTRVCEVELRGCVEGFFRNAKHGFAIHAFDKTQFTKTLFSIHDRRSIHSSRRNGLEMAVGVGYEEWLPDSSSQAPLNDGKR